MAIAFPLIPIHFQMPVIVAALVTEFLDGFIARRFHFSSRLGEILDPIADKLFFLSVCLTWISIGKLSLSELALLSMREIGIALIVLGFFISGRVRKTKTLKAKALGKITTVLQYITFFSLAYWAKPLSILLITTAVVGSLASIQYLFLLLRKQTGGI